MASWLALLRGAKALRRVWPQSPAPSLSPRMVSLSFLWLSGPGLAGWLQGTDDSPGMIPLALTEVFRLVERSPKKEFLIRMSMMEIYNEVSALPACTRGD